MYGCVVDVLRWMPTLTPSTSSFQSASVAGRELPLSWDSHFMHKDVRGKAGWDRPTPRNAAVQLCRDLLSYEFATRKDQSLQNKHVLKER